jgi:putative glutamine amidotransferase
MPLIGVVPSARMCDYEAALHRAGGAFRLLDPMHDDPADVLKGVDGLMLTGGGVVHPELFGEAPHETFVPAEPGRDEHEIALVTVAVDADLPVFAICRGLQVLNVARGGTLVQDIPSSVAGGVNHQIAMPKNAVAHEVWVNRDSLLWKLLEERLEGGDTCAVNSRHHQSVKALAAGFVVSATAPDGVIEAIERPGATFCVGVQWHPENFWRTGEFRELFEGFLEAAAERARPGSRPA